MTWDTIIVLFGVIAFVVGTATAYLRLFLGREITKARKDIVAALVKPRVRNTRKEPWT